MTKDQDRRKPYADLKRSLEIQEGEPFFLKITPVRGVIAFLKSGKLSQKYVGPFEILKRVEEVAYQLALLTTLTSSYHVLYIYIC